MGPIVAYSKLLRGLSDQLSRARATLLHIERAVTSGTKVPYDTAAKLVAEAEALGLKLPNNSPLTRLRAGIAAALAWQKDVVAIPGESAVVCADNCHLNGRCFFVLAFATRTVCALECSCATSTFKGGVEEKVPLNNSFSRDDGVYSPDDLIEWIVVSRARAPCWPECACVCVWRCC